MNPIYRYIFPNKCIFCMEELEESTTDICNVCYNKIKVIDETFCRRCGKLRELEDDLCLDCLTRGHEFEAGRGVFVYDDRVKKALFGLKFYNQTWIAGKMGRIMAEYYLEHVGWEIDYVMPVPIHYFKYITRGYNQAGVLASYFVQAYNEQMLQFQGRPVKLLKKGLKRIKWTAPQKDLNPETRYKNLENAFIVNAKIMDEVKNCNVLIIDDIYTTGATMDVCARQLKTAQVGKVFFITAAMGSGL